MLAPCRSGQYQHCAALRHGERRGTRTADGTPRSGRLVTNDDSAVYWKYFPVNGGKSDKRLLKSEKSAHKADRERGKYASGLLAVRLFSKLYVKLLKNRARDITMGAQTAD